MPMLAEALVALLIVVGGSFVLVGSWGLAKLPTVMTRLHGPTKATTLGVGACLIASMVYFPVFGGDYSAHELLITVFLFLTAPVSANMVAKAHLHLCGRDAAPSDGDFARGLPPTGTPADWATFQSLAPESEQLELDEPTTGAPPREDAARDDD